MLVFVCQDHHGRMRAEEGPYVHATGIKLDCHGAEIHHRTYRPETVSNSQPMQSSVELDMIKSGMHEW